MNPYWSYFKYVCRHKRAVYQEARKLGVGFWQAFVHDFSKFSRHEFTSYMRRFTLKDTSQEAEDAFHGAWLHHIHNNPHHWEHWVLRHSNGTLTVLRMPERYVREMVADWRGVAVALGQRPEEANDWYLKNRDAMAVHPQSRNRAEVLMGLASPMEVVISVPAPAFRELGT